jgi:hypothetical protein
MDAVLSKSRHYIAFFACLWLVGGVIPIAVGQIQNQPLFSVATPNFKVLARDPEWAKQVAEAAEKNRKELAIHWLGQELPRWSSPCPVIVQDGPTRLASGETNYTLINGQVINFKMTVVGTRERIIDSVLPHEVTHTVIASHFAPLGKPVPRWADEGMCTTVEHDAERSKHDSMLVRFLSEGKGIPFGTLFLLTDYPADMLPLYAQGYSLTSFLIHQGGPRNFIRFLELGMRSDDGIIGWVAATNQVYEYPTVGKLQTAWNLWVADGGGEVIAYTAQSLGLSGKTQLASASVPVRNALQNQSQNPVQTAVAWVPAQGVDSAVQPASNILLAANETTSPLANNSMHQSSGSYYLEQLRLEQQKAKAPTSSQAPVPHTVGHPRPMQTIGGGTIFR